MAFDVSHHNCNAFKDRAVTSSTTRRRGKVEAVSVTQAETVNAVASVKQTNPSKSLGDNLSSSSRPSNTKRTVGNNTLTVPTPQLAVVFEMRTVPLYFRLSCRSTRGY